MERYSRAIEEQMAAFYQSLSEKDRRRYAAIEAYKLGRGGLSYMARVLRCDRHTIAQGVQELADAAELQRASIRRAGGASTVTRVFLDWTPRFCRSWSITRQARP